MSHALSLHHVTAMEVTPPELVSIASGLSLAHVCLFTSITPEAAPLFPVDWTPEVRRETRRRCDDLGVKVHNLEWFDVTPEAPVEAHRHGLELGASFGARTATTHVVDTDPSRAADNFARFCELAAEYGIAPCIEFTPIVGTPTLATTLDLIERSGAVHAGIALDALHFVRSGGTVAELRNVAPSRIRSMQISDGPLASPGLAAYTDETVFQRMVPGTGEFPLADLLGAVPDDLIIDVEVPLRAQREAGIDARERCRMAVDGARSVVRSAAR